MLTSGANQYLRPEYLTPLPTTLDAKKSPLALLAQTCSQIGADSASTKLISSLDKQKKLDAPREREKASPASSVGSNISAGDNIPIKSCFKPYETHGKEESFPDDRGSVGSRARTPSSKSSTSDTPGSVNGNRCASNQSSSYGPSRSSPTAGSRKTQPGSEAKSETTTQPPAVPTSVSSPPSKGSFSSSLLASAADPLLKDLPLGTFKPGAGLPLASGLFSGYPGASGPFPLDVMANSFLSPHALKGGLNPYLNVARMKSTSGVEPLLPLCRDPYCTGCQLNSHLIPGPHTAGKSAGPCPGGCAQCDHATKSSSFLPSATAAAAYAHAQLAALAAASQLPYVCNWIAGDAAYCGKRFSNSEELLQHLKTHTSITNSDNSSASPLSLLSPPPGLPPALPLLHRNYPTPPLSPLATARYHPYSKSPVVPPFSSLGFPLPPHPGLSPYLSPYALYGQRLGASGLHP